jgi:DNA or RNA helicases of superfamily II
MPPKKQKVQNEVSKPFFEYLRSFYKRSRGQIRFSYKDLTKRLLDYMDPANAGAFLRQPQYEAFEMYVFLKEYLNNPALADLLDQWRHNEGKFQLQNTPVQDQGDFFLNPTKDAARYEAAFQKLSAVRQDYANYIFALTMGVGKTILMAVCIYYEFLLARKFPQDERFCHNVIVFAPDTTVLQSLKEIQDFDKAKILPPEYARSIESEVKFHFLEEAGVTLNVLDRSAFNVVISNTQKIILKRQSAEKSPAQKLFQNGWKDLLAKDKDADLYAVAEDEGELAANQRFQKLARLHQLGIFVDEAHHAFGKTLGKDMGDHSSATSLRLTIDILAKELSFAGTKVVACYNFTGTPYIENELMPEVVYAFSLKQAIDAQYLKTASVTKVENAKSLTFIRNALKSFVAEHGDRRYEGMLPKMAIFAATIEELQDELMPQVEKVVAELGLPTTSILVNVGDEKLTGPDDIREFRALDSKDSEKRFILLVGKGKEGWNCRSLFSVALFRQPKSKIFVLQATMRCLRSITGVQQEGHIFLSAENYEILEKELEANFRLSVDDFQSKANDGKKRVIVRPRKPLVFVDMVESKTMYSIERKDTKPGFALDLENIDVSRYRIVETTTDIRRIENGGDATRDLTALREDVEYSELSLIAEIARYLNMSPLEVEDILSETHERITTILAWVNRANDILFDIVIPRLFKELYDVQEYQGPKKKVRKLLVKEPPEGDSGYEIRVDPALFAEEVAPDYAPLSEKSFHLSGYGFDSSPELEFFKLNLPNEKIKRIWFTGMLTAGQTEFNVHYIDPSSNALRTYYPDFLIELEDGSYLIAEVKGEHMLDDPVTQAKKEYAQKMADENRMRYVLIPSKQASHTFVALL